VSLAWDGREVEHRRGPSLGDVSADGRFIVFSSDSGGYVPGDTNQTTDVFLHDRWIGMTERVSLTWNGDESVRGGAYGSMTADGRYVSFHSSSRNLIEGGDTNGYFHVFLRDRLAQRTVLVSLSSSGEQSDENSAQARINRDARYVAFASYATNLVPGDTNGHSDVFVRDLVASTTVRISVSSGGEQGNGDSGFDGIDISPDGRFVAFGTEAELADNDRFFDDVYLHDRDADEDGVFDEPGAIRTELMSNLFGPHWWDGIASYPTIGAPGKTVVYQYGGIAGGDSNGADDVISVVRGAEWFLVISHAWRTANTGNAGSFSPFMSDDERYVAFTSTASNLIPNDTNGFGDIFLFDYEDASNTRVSVGLNGAEPDNWSDTALLTPNACFVVFQSRASNLIEGDTNNTGDIFVAPTGICPAEDFNGDATVDAADLEFFDLCLSGPADDRPQRCVPADFNRDHHVDLADFVVVQAAAARP
jgi:Tol biopolymer transport system component